MNNNPSKFGDILYRERTKLNMSLQSLSEFIGTDSDGKFLLSPSYLNRLEKKETKNPSFINVCLLTRKLKLDLNEVFDSFGFKDLIKNNKATSGIQEILRTNDISVPLSKDFDGNIDNFVLNFEEKETLISILNTILNIGIVEDNEILIIMNELIKKIRSYKDIINERRQ